jgi:hypothetical protein
MRRSLYTIGMLILSERDVMTHHTARLRGGFLVDESIKAIKQSVEEVQGLLAEAAQVKLVQTQTKETIRIDSESCCPRS